MRNPSDFSPYKFYSPLSLIAILVFIISSYYLLIPSLKKSPKTISLKLITYNIQDLMVVSSHHEIRMKAIAKHLSILDPDLVGFQEAFIEKDRKILIQILKASSRLQYHQYYPSRVSGSGLLISSAFPIQEIEFHQFKESNPFYKVWEGDWWAGKGVALARIKIPELGVVDFYNTHAQAGYGNPQYKKVRLNQMIGLAQFINQTRTPQSAAFLVGDMNCSQGDEDFNAAQIRANLFRLMNIPSRIDHIFSINNNGYSMKVVKTLPIAGKVRIKKLNIPWSDHYGYLSKIEIILK